MHPEKEESVSHLIKRASVRTFTSSNKSIRPLKVHDKVIEIKQNCNLFADVHLSKIKEIST